MKVVDFEDSTGVCTLDGKKNAVRKEKDGFTICYRASILERIALLFTGRIYMQLRNGKVPTIGISYEIEV